MSSCWSHYNSRFSISMQAVSDVGQDQSRPNSHAYAKRVSAPLQWHRMQPLLRLCKISLCLLDDSTRSVIRPIFSTASGYNSFPPVLDGKILSDFPTRSILSGDFAKVPLIVGYACLIVALSNAKVFHYLDLVRQQMKHCLGAVILQRPWRYFTLLSRMLMLKHWLRYANPSSKWRFQH